MPDPRRHAAALLAVLLLAAPASAAAEPTLLAQIEDATPTPQAQPPLSEDPPENLGGGDEQEPDEADPEPKKAAPLPKTGIESGLIALLGVGLIASGGGLRLTLRRDDAV
jgi:LPXTG-motif cell wall-anchored protein